MKDISELNPHNYPVTPILEANSRILLQRLMEFQDASEFDFKINSGLRSEVQQTQLIAEGKTNATHSKHLSFQAADIDDPDGKLAEWVRDNLKAVTNIGLWFEEFSHTLGWVHAQTLAPKSGNRIFIP